MTFFEHEAAARRYARARPYFHPQVVSRIERTVASGAPIGRALDVGCGTGQSTLALRRIATEVIGLDVSPAMLAVAPRASGLRFVAGSAERLPLVSGAFGLVTVALAFHWLDRDRFLPEARRVLAASGWLVLYANAFTGTMREESSFADWFRTAYLRRFPSPPRDRRPLTAAAAARHGLRLVGEESYTNDVVFSAAELAVYLTTQSNVIAAVEEGAESPDAAVSWLRAELAPLVRAPSGTFRFGGAIRYFRPSDA